MGRAGLVQPVLGGFPPRGRAEGNTDSTVADFARGDQIHPRWILGKCSCPNEIVTRELARGMTTGFVQKLTRVVQS